MRYYNFALNASAKQIKEKTTINLREYAYENTIAAVNNYMYKRLDNDEFSLLIGKRKIQLLQFSPMMKKSGRSLMHLLVLQGC